MGRVFSDAEANEAFHACSVTDDICKLFCHGACRVREIALSHQDGQLIEPVQARGDLDFGTVCAPVAGRGSFGQSVFLLSYGV
ncbi:hypothetical protein AB4144_56545, partial [Rhizobiaceae sp. 2RAB30]